MNENKKELAKIKVNILMFNSCDIEPKILNVKEFDNKELADEFIKDFNEVNGDNLATAELCPF